MKIRAFIVIAFVLFLIPAFAQEYVVREEAVKAIFQGMKDGMPLEFLGVSTYRSVARLRFKKSEKKEIVLDIVHPSVAQDVLFKSTQFALASPYPQDVPRDLLDIVVKRLSELSRVEHSNDRMKQSHSSWFVPRPSVFARPVHPLNRRKIDVPVGSVLETAQSLAFDGKCKEALEALTKTEEKKTSLWFRVSAYVKRMCQVQEYGLGDILQALEQTNRLDSSWLETALETLETLLIGYGQGETGWNTSKKWNLIENLSRTLHNDLPYIFDHEVCPKVEALNMALDEGLLTTPLKTGTLRAQPITVPLGTILGEGTERPPRCYLLFDLRLATAKNDDELVDSTASSLLVDKLPRDKDVLFLWGSYYFAQGANENSVKKALMAWDILAQLDPFYPTFIGQYGTLCLVSDRLRGEKVLKFKEQADAEPSNALAQYLAGLGFYYARDYKKALEYLGRAQKFFPEDPRVNMYYGMSLFFTGRKEESLKLLESLTAYAYQEPDIYYCRSLVYRSFDLQRAIKEMEMFLEVFEGEKRLRFGELKVEKAKSDLERMRRGEVPEIELPTPDPIQ